MKKIIILFFPLVILTVTLAIVHVVVSNLLSTAGVELDRIQTELTKYKKDNIVLREQVLMNTSLTQIASTAAELGFVDAKSNVYLPEHVPLAKR